MSALGLIAFKSVIIGALGGAAVGAGAARMFHTPNSQSMGAFRTLGELNACQGDVAAHYSFGLGFLMNCAAAVVASGALTQDVFHRVIPNLAAGTLLIKDKSVENTLHNPKKMAIMGGIIGIIMVTFLNTLASIVPEELAKIAGGILTPAATSMISIVMPIIFWLAAIDAGKKTGMWATILGGTAQLVMGNAVPGCVLGILIGQNVEEKGYVKSTNFMIAIVVVLYAAIAYFRSLT